MEHHAYTSKAEGEQGGKTMKTSNLIQEFDQLSKMLVYLQM